MLRIHAPSNIISSFKSNTEGSTRLAADGISYRQLAGTREYESNSHNLDKHLLSYALVYNPSGIANGTNLKAESCITPLLVSSKENTEVCCQFKPALYVLTCISEKDRHTEIIRSKNYCKSHVQSSQAEPEQRTKRQYIKRSSKWKNLTQSSQLREEMFLRAPNRYDSAIRPTATRHDSTRY
jgi:hypothetical protein